MSRWTALLHPSRLRAYWRRRASLGPTHDNRSALREELYSADQMERHGQVLAAAHRLSTVRSRDRLLARLADNEKVLIEVCQLLTQVSRQGRRITPAAEWLLDNFYLIEEQIRTAQRHLPRRYSRDLPRLATGPSAGLPRVYDIALEAIAHCDGRVDAHSLRRFVTSYQDTLPLTLGELWAIPIMLRLALIESLRHVGARIAADKKDRWLAERWADELMDVAERDPKNVVLTVADMARSELPMSSAFVAELSRRLIGQGAGLTLPLTWVEHWLAEAGQSMEHLVQHEAQQQAAHQVSVGNSIASLRELSAIDWREFVEATSAVEQVLGTDPAGVYRAMEFATRDRYRHVVERLARRSRLSELEVAGAAVDLAQEAGAEPGEHSSRHVGYFLLGPGIKRLERRIHARAGWSALRRTPTPRLLLGYLSAMLIVTVLCVLPLIIAGEEAGIPGQALALMAIPLTLACSQLASALVNWSTTLHMPPTALPRMDFSKGIPEHARTLVVVPTLLSSLEGADALAEALEIRFLANRDSNLHFALLTDFNDCASESHDHDDLLLARAVQRIVELNGKYAPTSEDRFFLFHRPRCWHPGDCVWMGFERKRGKLADLNALLRGNGEGRFSRVVGNTAALMSVRYVITLDTDTELPRETAAQLVGAMEHPLNRPLCDHRRRLVVSGHGILQPRVGVSLPSAARSPFARLFGSDAGIDPYTRAVSDVYQDLFDEGSFIGKGIYDVDAFECALGDRFPDNAILSHDLVEGCFARAGLVSDVQLYEEYPTSYLADVRRRHRWIRGDWQLLPWLMPLVPTRKEGRERNPLSALSRWKMFDNLRRSLVAPALVLLLLLGWLLPGVTPWWTVAMLGILMLPPLLSSILEFVHKSDEVLLQQHLAIASKASWKNFICFVLMVAWLPHEAAYSLDAIVRTLWRMSVSRRRLLEWRPSGELSGAAADRLPAMIRAMWMAPAIAVATFAALVWLGSPDTGIAAPALMLWFVSPLMAWQASRPSSRTARRLVPEQRHYLRRLARKTWAFFDAYVGPDDNWLPPDNIQEAPSLVVAHRTSPTNIGLALLANLAAHDFGYASNGRVLERCACTLGVMQSLERYRGHFYNWYDTRSLLPLPPRYVSAVDSGNLAGHLLTLRAGLRGLVAEPILSPCFLAGLADTFELVAESHGDVRSDAMRAFRLAASQPMPASLTDAYRRVLELFDCARSVRDQLPPDQDTETAGWAACLVEQCHDAAEELGRLVPWLKSGVDVPLFEAGPIPNLADLAAIDPEAVAPEQREQVKQASANAVGRLAEIERVAGLAGEMARPDFAFLYDSTRHLFAIGYNVQDHRLDGSYYDLLASEARLASFVAIAQGQLPQEGWFALGRLLTTTGGEPVLLSWSGSMFEYLMPLLVMPTYEETLLDQTCRAAVARQLEYGRQRSVPWGVSECGYNTVDAQLNYQYRAFGVPGLGLKRGLGEDLVIAPYASALALMVAPEAACENLQRLSASGVEGRYGMYEAVDYTLARLPRGQTHTIVRSFMAHHQGMSLLSLAYALLDQPMQRRFESDPQFQATTLLLQERIPKTAAQYLHVAEFPSLGVAPQAAETKLRLFTDPNSGRPAVQLLSNGRYHVMVNSAGSGYSRVRDLAITRWQEDCTNDVGGAFCYLRDVDSGDYWSTTYQPCLRQVERYEAILSGARAEFRCHEQDWDVRTDIVVSPEDDIELRRTTILNNSRMRRTIEVTSYAEIVLAPAIADALHPAFSKLFVQTELIPSLQTILCTRRPRSAEERVPWLCHLLAVHGGKVESVSYETDRARFIGRGRGLANPQALDTEQLSNSEGSVLDPIVAIRCRITLEPDQSATLDLVTGFGDGREACLGLVEKYRDRRLADRVFDMAWTHNQVMLHQLNASESDGQLFERLAGSILYATPALRADPVVLGANRRSQSGLWGQSVSGDLPLVLVKISDAANIELVRKVVMAQTYWRMKGLMVDLVIWNEDRAGYRQNLHDLIMGLVASGHEASLIDKPGGIYVRQAHQLSSEERVLMQAAARVILTDAMGTLADQIGRRPLDIPLPPAIERREGRAEAGNVDAPGSGAPVDVNLLLDNGLGGFTVDGSEYVIRLVDSGTTPAPWVNVLANEFFGTVVSESGSAYTWGENAHEFRLTPWSNDPVVDRSGEAFYIRDEDSGAFWSPCPAPRRGKGAYIIRHGFGYSVFEHVEDGIESELCVHVASDASVKFWSFKLRNVSGRTRRLSVTGYLEWVLGDLRGKHAMHVVTETDSVSGALLARNAFNIEFPERVAFFDADVAGGYRSVTGDRGEFLGRNRGTDNPAALARTRLSGRLGAGMDPCGAIQITFELAPDEAHELSFRAGLGRDRQDARALVERFRTAGAATAALAKTREHWRSLLTGVQVRTPDPGLNVLANGWLLYQTIACRFWARSGFYQSGGAYGFRDQLQDAMAMVVTDPARVRQHLLLCASHQFPEGDVQHWWHPPLDRGVRTRCSDDFLWLPLATCRYIEVTGDYGVLDEAVQFVEGRSLVVGEESYYDLPVRSGRSLSLYEHCQRALEKSRERGARGLPLMGSGDWNDGMNRVGEHGQGESVWLGFFLFDVLTRFARVAAHRQDNGFASHCLADAETLRANIESESWDGAWYRRAYFDDGRPLGSAGNEECQIDSIAQSWSVLSGAGRIDRRRQAMQSLYERLVRPDARVVQLLDPPFDRSAMDPGYIKGYVPGVRENGGQYTHAAVWAAMAFAELGDGARAWELFDLINPANHGLSPDAIAVYKVEPYVAAADVYAVTPHVGRGGWTWYTGSAGWMYRLILESLLGLRVEQERLVIRPVPHKGWSSYELTYRFRQTPYRITVLAPVPGAAVTTVTLDGRLVQDGVPLRDDGVEHRVEVRVGEGGMPSAGGSVGE